MGLSLQRSFIFHGGKTLSFVWYLRLWGQRIPEKKIPYSSRTTLFKRSRRVMLVVSSVILVISSVAISAQLRPVKHYRLMTAELEGKLQHFYLIVAQLEQSATHQATKVNADDKGELYVVIIGESLSRDSMGLYNHCLDNTPYLTQLVTQGKALYFKNAYSSFVNTVPSITASFSQGNLQTGLTFPQGDNLISMAKKAGFKTYWISNQVQNGDFDTPIGALSSLADYNYFTTRYLFDHAYGAQQPDLILMPELERTLKSLDSSANNLVIIHLMGCHSPYENRFPSDYPEIELSQAANIGALSAQPQFSEEMLGASDYEQYLTSIRYNDDVIKAISKQVLERDDFAAMLYYSDHGEALLYQSHNDIVPHSATAPAGRHNVAQFSFAMTRIPLIIALSERYQRNYPETAQALQQHLEAIFTNDTLYDLVLDLMQVKSQAINYELALSNPNYQRGAPSQIELLNHKIVGTDPDYLAFQHAQLPDSDKLAINAANSTFKANSSLAKGYSQLAINTIWRNGQLYVRALKNFSEDFYTLPKFLGQVRDRDKQPLLTSTARVIVQLDNSKELNADEQNELRSYLKALAPEVKAHCLFVTNNAQLLTTNDAALKWGLVLPDANDLAQVPEHVTAVLSLEQLQTTELPAHQSDVIVIAPELCVQDPDFKSQFDQLMQVKPYGLIVSYYNAFDSDL